MDFGESILNACFWSPGKLCIHFFFLSLKLEAFSKIYIPPYSLFLKLPIFSHAQQQLLCEALDPCTSGMRIPQVALLWQMVLCPTEALAWIQSRIFFPSTST